jgi:magnesium chelatase accessory protein
MSRALDWDSDGLIWPHRDASQFVRSGAGRWHVQRMGPRAVGSPQLLLLHGTGGSVHSWRDIMPVLAKNHDVIAMDIPRHAFTSGHPPDTLSLPAMAREISALIDTLELQPNAIVGHSAGAALALQLALSHGYEGPIVGLNAALKPFPGLAAQLFPAFAKLLFINPLVPRIFAHSLRRPGEAERFLQRATGSSIDAEGMACYASLFQNSRHAKGALAMMANWDLPRLNETMESVTNPVLLLHSDGDRAIPVASAEHARDLLPNAELEVLSGLGHLAHEEAPAQIAEHVLEFLAAQMMRQ